jgi:dTMP kinase
MRSQAVESVFPARLAEDGCILFFSLDGIDGTGKSTQLALCESWLRGLGHDVVICRDPGSTPLGESIRAILLDSPDTPISRTAEMLLYMAARAQLVSQVIRPALESGKVVLADRYLLANVVYQGHAGGLDVDELWRIGRTATGGLEPNLTVVLDMPPQAAQARLTRPLDRMEREGDDFRRRLRTGFLVEAGQRPERIMVVDAARPIEVVHAEIRLAISERFFSLPPGRSTS